MKIYIYTELSKQLRQRITDSLKSHEVIFRSAGADEEKFYSAEIVFGNPPPTWFGKKNSIRFWQLDSAGFDQYSQVKVEGLIANMGDYFSVKCAETMVAGVLAFYRKIHELVRLQVQSKWVGRPLRYEMDLLTSKNVVILGAGTIAMAIREMLQGFRCNVVLTARKNTDAKIRSRDSLLQELPGTDLLINTLPGKASQYVDEEIFNSLKQGALYASVGRGNTTNEKALLHALESGKLAGAILDVTEKEPLPEDNRLWSMENVILTQHTGGGHKLEDEGKVNLFLQNFEKYLQGTVVANRIDLSAGY